MSAPIALHGTKISGLCNKFDHVL